MRLEGVSQVSGDHTPEPPDVTKRHGCVKPEFGADSLLLFKGRVLIHIELGGVARQVTQQEHDKGDDQKANDPLDESIYDEPKHDEPYLC